jgi:hypothetical protein
MELMMTSRTLSTPVLDAASISITSIEREEEISIHEGHWPHGSVVIPVIQLRHLASIRAVVVFPTPRAPVKR